MFYNENEALLLLRAPSLRLLSPNATHQHYKGGLYQFFANVTNANDGGEEDPTEALYAHRHPHELQYFRRSWDEVNAPVTLTEDDALVKMYPGLTVGTQVQRFLPIQTFMIWNFDDRKEPIRVSKS